MKNQVLKLGTLYNFSSSRSQKIKFYENLAYETVSAYILGFTFYGVSRSKTNLHNKYMI